MTEAVERFATATGREARPPRLLGVFASWRLQAYGYLLAAIYAALLLLMYKAGGWLAHNNGLPAYSDFTTAWVAGVQAWHGNVAPLYDPAQFVKLQSALTGIAKPSYANWPYPPTFFLLLAPFGLLRYVPAFLCWDVATLAGCLAAVALIARRMPAFALVLASPFTAWNFQAGQNGFLTAALFGGALHFLERRPVLAGVFVGVLTYKPQFGILFPVALIAGRQWRAFASAAATAFLLAGASLAAFGADAWMAFPRELLAQTGGVLVEGGRGFFANPYSGYGYIQTVYGVVRRLHGDAAEAWVLQGVVSVAAAIVVWRVWRSPARPRLKAAVLSAAALLATPYAFAYDLVALAIPVAFLAADQMRHGLLRGEQTVLLVLFGAGFAILAAFGSLPLGPFIVGALLVLLLRRVVAASAASAAPAQAVEGW